MADELPILSKEQVYALPVETEPEKHSDNLFRIRDHHGGKVPTYRDEDSRQVWSIGEREDGSWSRYLYLEGENFELFMRGEYASNLERDLMEVEGA